MVGGEDGDQHIGVVADLVQVEVVLVIAGVQAGIVVQLVLERRLHPGVCGLGPQHILVPAGVGGTAQRGQPALQQNGTGGHAVEQQADAGQKAEDDADALLVPNDEIGGVFGLLRRLFRGPGGVLHGGGGGLAGLHRGGVLLLNGPLLLPAGEGVAGKLGVVVEVLLIQRVHVGLFQLPLRPCRLPVGPQLWAR